MLMMLIRIIVRNRTVMIVDIPLRDLDWVRRSWERMISLKEVEGETWRVVKGHIRWHSIRIIRILVNRRRVVVGMKDLNIKGSKEEKISGIMQSSGSPNGDFEGP